MENPFTIMLGQTAALVRLQAEVGRAQINATASLVRLTLNRCNAFLEFAAQVADTYAGIASRPPVAAEPLSQLRPANLNRRAS